MVEPGPRQGLRPTPVIYLFDGTLEGLFSAIFAAYARHELPEAVQPENGFQGNLLASTLTVPTSMEYALRVRDGICRKLSSPEYERIRMASLSDEADRGGIILRYVVCGMQRGPGIWNDLSNPDVQAFERLWQGVYNERHRILQFARFSLMEGGVYFAQVNPKANVVPVVMDHFAGRMNVQPFVIYDEVHHVAGIWDRTSWSLVATDELTVPPPTCEDADYTRLWRTFYEHICNQQRYNPRLRAQSMPQRLWKNITEMQPNMDVAHPGRRLDGQHGKTENGHLTEDTDGPQGLSPGQDRDLPPTRP